MLPTTVMLREPCCSISITLQWDKELLSMLNIPAAVLPTVMPSSYIYGETIPNIFGIKLPICGIAGDQQAALFGQACYGSRQREKYLRHRLFYFIEHRQSTGNFEKRFTDNDCMGN